MKFAGIALWGAINVAAAQHLNHVHRHHARHGSPVEARAAVIEIVPGPTVTVYELNGHDLSYADVEEGLKDGKYVLVSDTSSTVVSTTTSAVPTTTSTSTPTPTPTTSSTNEAAAAEFYQQKSSTTTPSEEPTPAPKPSAAPPASTPEASSSYSSGTAGNSGDFPSGTIKCNDFNSLMNYGAISVDWLNLGGWSGIQNTPGFNFVMSSNAPIVTIETAVSGSTCTPGSFCSYACGPGFQKIQWPASQGSTGESIGGLWCNNNNFLELTREGVSQICGAGAGGIEVENTLGQNVAICRTDYPGTEGETIPMNVLPGATDPLTNPISADYYTWKGSATTAQYYVNNGGVSVQNACQWGTAGSNQGNWAPLNIGVGVGAGGITYMSIFPNAPTNPDGKLNFNIKITGDANGGCSYSNGNYYRDGVESPTGCTAAVPSGGSATFVFY